MSRPLKRGLDYFPLDVDIFNDDKIQFVSAKFEEKGELLVIKLLCKIFREGYFIQWSDDIALLFAKNAGKNISYEFANDVVNELVKREFFDKIQFEKHGILTSYGIQKRYIRICKDAKRCLDFGTMKYSLFHQKELTPEKNKLPPEETPLIRRQSTQRKEKKSKVKDEEITAPAIKVEFLEDPMLLETWVRKALPKNEFENGIDIFICEQLEESYATWNKLRQHFIYWMPNYYKSAEPAKKVNGNHVEAEEISLTEKAKKYH